ncbi:hypothetical protein ABFS83_05G113700 [Erythranthe nasuta]
MESGNFSWEYETLINELTQGMEKAKLLQFHLCSTTSPSRTQHLLLQRILSSYEKSLSILNWRGGQLAAPPPTSGGGGAPESSISVDGSPTSDDWNKNFGDRNKDYTTSKKRKIQPTWTEQVRVNPENGLEGPTDDGYSWRKYGQKDILGAKHPRSYYRCTYRLAQNCFATKQVQRSDEDPTIFEVTYKGAHTCNQSSPAAKAAAPPPPASPENQELNKHNPHNNNNNQTLVNLKANLRVTTECTPPQFSFQSENYYLPISGFAGENHLCQYSPQFLSPSASETNYFSPANYGSTNFGGNDIADIISGHASTTNSPIGGMEFPFDPVDLDPIFPFNNASGFFT